MLAEVGQLELDELARSPRRGSPGRRDRRRRLSLRSGHRRRRSPLRRAAARRCAGRSAPGSAPWRALRSSPPRRPRAPGAVGNAKKNASPCVSTSTPPSAAQASRIRRRCSASASAYPSAPSSCSSFVEPSTSVKRKVTVPEGRSARTGVIMRQSKVRVTREGRVVGRHARKPPREGGLPHKASASGRVAGGR